MFVLAFTMMNSYIARSTDFVAPHLSVIQRVLITFEARTIFGFSLPEIHDSQAKVF